METRQNIIIFKFLSSLDNPELQIETILRAIISFKWKSISAFSRDIGLSHTAVNNALTGKSKPGKADKKVFNALGIQNPWA